MLNESANVRASSVVGLAVSWGGGQAMARLGLPSGESSGLCRAPKLWGEAVGKLELRLASDRRVCMSVPDGYSP
jgi:hypothetical protein